MAETAGAAALIDEPDDGPMLVQPASSQLSKQEVRAKFNGGGLPLRTRLASCSAFIGEEEQVDGLDESAQAERFFQPRVHALRHLLFNLRFLFRDHDNRQSGI